MNDYKIKELMEEMELELISSMKRNLSRHLKEENKVGFDFPQWQAEKLKELKKYQRENKDIIDGYTKGLDKNISKHLRKELTQGAKKSLQEYNKILGKNLKASKVLNKSFFKTNDKKVNTLIKVVNNDLKTANTSALRMINDEYRQVIHKSAFFLANGTISPQKAIDMATNIFLSRGLNCIEYKDGRRVNIASYCEMAVRTTSLRAQLMGDGDFRKSIKRPLVIAMASNAACPLCSRWEDKVMIDDIYSGGSKKDGNYPLLSDAMKQGFLHPNCRDGIGTYYQELEDIDKSYEDDKDGSESDEAYQDDLNYLNLRIKQFTRLAIGSLDKENIEKYTKQKLLYEKKKEELLIIREDMPYKDVTEEWLEDIGKEKGTRANQEFFIDNKGVKHDSTNATLIFDHSESEESIADWFAKAKKKNIKMLPRVVNPKGIKSADFIEDTSKITWEIKEPIGNTTDTTMLNQFKGQREKAHNFIIDLHLSEMNNDKAINEVIKIFNSKRYEWVEEVVLLRNKKVIKIFKR